MRSELDQRDMLIQPAAAGPGQVRDTAAAHSPGEQISVQSFDLSYERGSFIRFLNDDREKLEIGTEVN